MSNINFEADQREDLHNIKDAQSLSDQVVKLKQLEDQLEEKENELKELKRKNKANTYQVRLSLP